MSVYQIKAIVFDAVNYVPGGMTADCLGIEYEHISDIRIQYQPLILKMSELERHEAFTAYQNQYVTGREGGFE